MMPTFPQHRNMKGTAKGNGTNPPAPNSMDTGVNDQTMNLPAISDLVKHNSCHDLVF
jgi:hypothetical protein